MVGKAGATTQLRERSRVSLASIQQLRDAPDEPSIDDLLGGPE
jgi:hypothetical protein